MAAGEYTLDRRGHMPPYLWESYDVELNGQTEITIVTGLGVIKRVVIAENDTTNDTYQVKCKKSTTAGKVVVWCTNSDVTSTVGLMVYGYN